MSPLLSLLALCSVLGQASAGATIPASAEERLIKDLVAQAAGYSSRGDFVVHTPADQACDSLVAIGKPAVPFLIGALKSPTGWLRVHAIEVLAKIKDPAAMDPILDVLRSDKDQQIRGIAAANLAAFGDPRVVPDLMKAAEAPPTPGLDGNALARGAWKSLGELRANEAIGVLTRHLDAKTVALPGLMLVSDYTPFGALVSIGPSSVPGLIEAFRHGSEDVRESSANALGSIGTDAAVDCLIRGLNDPTLRKAAIDGLRVCSNPAADTVAIKLLSIPSERKTATYHFIDHPNPACLHFLRLTWKHLAGSTGRDAQDFRTVAPFVFEQLKDRDSVPLLIAAVQRSHRELNSIAALGKIGDSRALPLLVDLLVPGALPQDWGHSSRYAARALAGFGMDGVRALQRCVERSPARAAMVGDALSEFKSPECGPALCWFLRSSVPSEARIGALEALGNIAYAPAADTVAGYLGSANVTERDAATRGLADMGDPRAIAGLMAFATLHKEWDLTSEWSHLGKGALPQMRSLMLGGNVSAAQAVASLPLADSEAALKEGLTAADAAVAAVCAKGLGSQGARCQPELLRALERPEMTVRVAAYLALRKIPA